MKNLFNRTVEQILKGIAIFNFLAKSLLIMLFGRFQSQQFLSIVLISFVILTINTEVVPPNNQALANKLNSEIHQDGESRPKTDEEWSQQAAETEGRPLERLKRVGAQTQEALKDFGAIYPDTFPEESSK
jgi:hypothetical protein